MTFYFDLGSPYAYLTAERLQTVLPEPVQWQPVSLGGLFKLADRSSWSLGDPERRRAGIAEVERRARQYELPPLRWPEPWPGNYLAVMRAATFAQKHGQGNAFAIKVFRSAFQEGRDHTLMPHILQSASEAGLDPWEVERAIADPQIKLLLREATEKAHQIGVFGVPTIAIHNELFWGDDRLEEAAACMHHA